MSTGRDNALALDRANGPHIAYSDSRHPDVYLRYANFNAFDRQFDYNGPPQHAWKQFPPTRWVYLPALRVH